MLESEAKTKWCPHARVVFGYKVGTTETFNRFVYSPEDKDAKKIVDAINEHKATKCLGSDCMMWEKAVDFETSENKEKPDGEGWEEADAVDNPVLWFKEIQAGDCGFKNYSDECRL